MFLIVKATTALGHFYRLGHKFEKAGTFLDASGFTDAELTVLRDEPNLNVREATEDEIAAHQSPVSNVDVVAELVAMIPQLPDEAFGKSGLADLKALRQLTDLDQNLITADARDAAMEQLVKGGFKAPVKA